MRPQIWLLALPLLCLALIPTPKERAEVRQEPRVRLRISGNLQGYLEPCGCASGQLGGLARRAFRNAVDKRNIDLRIEGGQMVKHDSPLDEFKLMTILELLAQDGYQAVGIGKQDLAFESEMLAAMLSMVPALSADLRRKDGKPWLADGKPVLRSHREQQVGQLRLRLTALTMDLPEHANAKHFSLLPPAKAWQAAMAGAKPETLRILIAHASKKRLAKLELVPRPDLIICVSNDYIEPRAEADALGEVPLVHTGHKGRFMVDVHLCRRQGKPVLLRHELVKLEGSRTAPGAMESKTAKAILKSHREMVAADDLLTKMANQRDLPKDQGYIGSQTCAACHQNAAKACKDDAHGHAWRTLQEAEKKEGWPVTKYPECVSCHVVGYGYKTGFVSPERTPQLLNVGCENCHGPGRAHMMSGGKTPITKRGPGWQVRSCTQCHNAEHSPQFLYAPYWRKIIHGK